MSSPVALPPVTATRNGTPRLHPLEHSGPTARARARASWGPHDRKSLSFARRKPPAVPTRPLRRTRCDGIREVRAAPPVASTVGAQGHRRQGPYGEVGDHEERRGAARRLGGAGVPGARAPATEARPPTLWRSVPKQGQGRRTMLRPRCRAPSGGRTGSCIANCPCEALPHARGLVHGSPNRRRAPPMFRGRETGRREAVGTGPRAGATMLTRAHLTSEPRVSWTRTVRCVTIVDYLR